MKIFKKVVHSPPRFYCYNLIVLASSYIIHLSILLSIHHSLIFWGIPKKLHTSAYFPLNPLSHVSLNRDQRWVTSFFFKKKKTKTNKQKTRGWAASSLLSRLSLAAVHGLSCPVACGILASWPGIKPVSFALEGIFLNHWTTREVPQLCIFLVQFM